MDSEPRLASLTFSLSLVSFHMIKFFSCYVKFIKFFFCKMLTDVDASFCIYLFKSHVLGHGPFCAVRIKFEKSIEVIRAD